MLRNDGRSKKSHLSRIMIAVPQCLDSIQRGTHGGFSDKGVTCVVVFKENKLAVMGRANWKRDGEASLKIIPIIQI